MCLTLLASFLILVSGCAQFRKLIHRRKPAEKTTPKEIKKSSTPNAAKTGDSAAQQKYYDLGVKHYSEEKYAEAKKAWKQVIELGGHTNLANKARENIKKIDQILKTLEEMRAK